MSSAHTPVAVAVTRLGTLEGTTKAMALSQGEEQQQQNLVSVVGLGVWV